MSPIVFPLALAAALVFDVDTGKPSHYTTDIKAHPPVFTLSNPSGDVATVTGNIVVSNYFGEAISLPVKGTLPRGGTVRIPVDLATVTSGRTRGIWHARATVTHGGETQTNCTSFTHLPVNPITPRIPRGKFRIGMQYHMGRFPMEQQRANLDALAALGCKLLRVGGFHAHPCWKEGASEPDFSRADSFMALLKEYGMSANVFCWPNAKWMAEDADQKRPYPAYIRSRPKKGIMGIYSEKLAAHFGRDIDYIEPSNEPDFWDAKAMTIDDYIDYQREVYAGVKRGCKDIIVLSPGWAQADSSHPRTVLKGMQERVMSEAKDAYDVHAIHGHGRFREYEKQMTERFFPMREKYGVVAPWYANEAAATCFNGAEYAAAQVVWQKILWSRAHGSVDYIWYNLIATSDIPDDPENWFGVLSRSLHPRSTFASFAALTHLLAGLEYNSTVCEGKGRYIYRWQGTVQGKRRIVLAGWDEYAETPAEIRIDTDAGTARSYDIMGNEAALNRKDGRMVFSLGCVPSAVVFDGATRAEADKADLAKLSVPKTMSRVAKAKVKWRAPDFQLMCWWQVEERYAGNWETADRVWKGPEDLSANIYVGSEDGCLRVFFEVKDDKRAPHDGVWFSVEPPDRSRKFEFKTTFPEKGTVTDTGRINYDMRIPLSEIGFTEETLKNGFMFKAKVFDDDGIGDDIDNWMETHHCWVKIVFQD